MAEKRALSPDGAGGALVVSKKQKTDSALVVGTVTKDVRAILVCRDQRMCIQQHAAWLGGRGGRRKAFFAAFAKAVQMRLARQ